jgi:hypothetical protein
MASNDTLSIHIPEGNSQSTQMLTNQMVACFLTILRSLKKFPEFANGIGVFNLGETHTDTVQKPQEVPIKKGLKQVSKCVSAEKGTSVTTLCIILATGNKIPMVIIFPGVKPHMFKEAPLGILELANISFWLDVF